MAHPDNGLRHLGRDSRWLVMVFSLHLVDLLRLVITPLQVIVAGPRRSTVQPTVTTSRN